MIAVKTTPHWLPVTGYAAHYLVSQDGLIMNRKTEKLLKPYTNRQGYLVAKLHGNGAVNNVRVARAVASTFIPNPESKPQVNHINGVRTDNRVENLEWVTGYENQRHVGSVLKKRRGSLVWNSKLTEQDVIAARTHLFDSTAANRELTKHFGVSPSAMYSAITGLTWRYLNDKYPPRFRRTNLL